MIFKALARLTFLFYIISVTTIDKPKKQEKKPEDTKAVTPTKVADLEKEITKSTTVAVETYGKAVNAIRGKSYNLELNFLLSMYCLSSSYIENCVIVYRASTICARIGYQ